MTREAEQKFCSGCAIKTRAAESWRSAKQITVTACCLVVCLLGSGNQAFGICTIGPTRQCRDSWTLSTLLVGPTVLLDSPLVPIRFLGGAVAYTRDCDDCSTSGYIARAAGNTLIAIAYGTFHGFMDAVAGFVSIATAGFLDWTEDDPTRFTLQPIRFVHLGDVCCFWGRPYPVDERRSTVRSGRFAEQTDRRGREPASFIVGSGEPCRWLAPVIRNRWRSPRR